MADALAWITSNWMMVIGVLSTISMGASLIVKAIAPLTNTTKDDKAAAWLVKVNTWLSTIALNPPVK